MSDNYKAPDMSYFVSFTDIDGDVHIVGANAIQVVTWSQRLNFGTVGINGRCLTRINKDEWVHLVEELARYKAR